MILDGSLGAKLPWPAAVLILAVAAIALGLAASTGATPGDPRLVEPVISPEFPVSDPPANPQVAPSIAFEQG